MNRLPTDEKYKDFFKFIKQEIPDFFKDFDENTKIFLLNHPNEQLSARKQNELLEMAKRNKSLQIALLNTSHLDKLHIAGMFKDFVYLETKLEALRTGNASDDIISEICESVSLITLNNFFKKNEKNISTITYNAIVKDFAKKMEAKKDECCAEPYEIIALKNYRSPIANQKIFRQIVKSQFNKDIITALMNNQSIIQNNRDVLSNRDYEPSLIENPTNELLNTLYMSAVETLYDLDNSEKTRDVEKVAEEFLIKMIKNKQLQKDKQMDLICRIVNSEQFEYDIMTPVLKELILNSPYSDVSEFYASGALFKPQEFRDLLYKNDNLPYDTVASLSAIILDNIKEGRKVYDDELNFLGKQSHMAQCHPAVYSRFLDIYKNLENLDIDSDIKLTIKFCLENMAISKHTPSVILDDLKELKGNTAILATFNEIYKSETGKDLYDIFYITYRGDELNRWFIRSEDMLSNEYTKSLEKILDTAQKQLEDIVDENILNDMIKELKNQIKEAHMFSLSDKQLYRKAMDELRDEIKSNNIYDFYKNLDKYNSRHNEILQMNNTQNKEFLKAFEEFEEER